MKKHLIPILFAVFLLGSIKLHAQEADSAAMARSQKRIESNLKDADKLQRKIEKRQKRIEKQQKRINRKERKRDRKMRRIEKEQEKLSQD